ncbi:FecR family protein [Spirosoma litoris]
MQNYRDFTVEELAQDDFFQQSIQHPTAETDTFWKDFLAHHPEKQAVVVAASALLKAVENSQVLPTQEQRNRMWAGIQQQILEEPVTRLESEPRIHRIGLWRSWATAAAVLLLLGFGWWFSTKPSATGPSALPIEWSMDKPLVEQVNTTTKPLTVYLMDGSQVVLQPQSRMTYPKIFDPAKREIHLEGEGYFEVTKKPKQPFIVYADKVVTQVVGTSFTIKATPQSAKISIAVRTGKVAVFTLNALRESLKNGSTIANRLLLTPNQQAIFDTRSQQLTKRLVDEPVLIKQPQTNQYFVFENDPVSDVFSKLEQAYGVSIQYDTTAFKQCRLTAPLGNEPLFRKLDLVCQTIGATYEVWGTQIIISGQGCQTP